MTLHSLWSRLVLWTRFLALPVLLAGCGTSPPIHYHALSSGSATLPSGSAQILVEILPIALPERLNREEMVLTNGAGQIEVLASDHWAAPLSDEIRQSLSDALWESLRASDVYQAPVGPSASGLPHYRLALRIERFEAVPGRSAVVQGSWTLRRLPQGSSITCRASFAVALAGGTADAASLALSQASNQLTGQVANSLDKLNQDTPSACP